MNDTFLARYTLAADGAARNWLGCGPVLSPLNGIDRLVRASGSPFGKQGRWVLNYWAFDPASLTLKKRLYAQLPDLDWSPTQRPALHQAGIAGLRWEYRGAEEDNVIDFSRFCFTPTIMQAWLFAMFQVDDRQTLDAEIITIGPARLWVNGRLLKHYARRFSYVVHQYVPVRLPLRRGLNEIYLQGTMLAWREARLALGLRFPAKPPVTIRLPLGDISAERWHRAEIGLSFVNIKQFAFPSIPGRLSLHEDAPEPFAFDVSVALPRPDESAAPPSTTSQVEGRVSQTLKPGESGLMPITDAVADAMATTAGENTLTVRIRPADGTPLELRRYIWASNRHYSSTPYGDYDSRRREALEHLAAINSDVPSSMAAVALGRSRYVSSEAIATACHFLNSRMDCADFYAVGLLALLYWFGDDANALRPADKNRIEEAFTGFKFWIDEPGIDAMCYFTENHQILFHVSAHLAGQRWPERVFVNSGLTGREQMRRARPRIEDWIKRRLKGNFSEWDSNAYMALDAFAMLALVEFAQSNRLQAMATTLLHKLFFLLACQSFRGAHGSTHGRSYVTGLKSARVENTSSIQRIAWGMGIFNGETRAAGLLSLARRYRVPSIIQRIGADMPDVLVTRARSRADFRPRYDMKAGTWDVRTLTRRTPDVMLAAALDYRPGEMGIQEHLWQAMLGPEQVIFTTYPGNSQEHGHARPNFWAGSARLPRVAMHDRALICLYRLEDRVGLGFTHAYFPAAMFDEWYMEGQWAFARVGNGYAALWADGNLNLTDTGKHAAQELRTDGPGHAWACMVGSAREDGSFAAFQQKLIHHSPVAQGHHIIRWTTPTGETLEFDWTGPLRVNGHAQDWDDYPHYENRYTQTPLGDNVMRIEHEGQTLVLDLETGRAHEAQKKQP